MEGLGGGEGKGKEDKGTSCGRGRANVDTGGGELEVCEDSVETEQGSESRGGGAAASKGSSPKPGNSDSSKTNQITWGLEGWRDCDRSLPNNQIEC